VTYQAELDNVRQECRKAASQRLRFWPVLPGRGNALVSGTPTYATYEPDGTAITSGNATATRRGLISRIDVTVDASGLELEEDYACVITWSDGTDTHVDTVRFDVVTEPFVPGISLNDFVGELADADDRLTAMAATHPVNTCACSAVTVASNVATITAALHGLEVLDQITIAGITTPIATVTPVLSTADANTFTCALTASNGAMADGAGTVSVHRTSAQLAALLGLAAWGDVRVWLRRKAESEGRTYPQMIINREELRRVIIARALSRMYQLEGGKVDGEHALLAHRWAEEAEKRLAELPRIRYSAEQDRVEDEALATYGAVQLSRGGWD